MQKIYSFIVLLTIFIYPPLVFAYLIDTNIRLFLFFIMMALSAVYLLTIKSVKKIEINRLIMFLLLFALIVMNLFLANFNNVHNYISIFSILTFAVVISIMASISAFRPLINKITNMYVYFFVIVCLSVILSFIVTALFSSTNILDYDFSKFRYNYGVTPFGLVWHKNILGIDVIRSFSFFTEPVFISFFILINIFIIAPVINRKYFKLINVTAGLLTFSYYFYLMLIFILFIHNKTRKYQNSFIFLTLLIGIFNYEYFLQSSSLDDRIYRFNIWTDIFQSYNLTEVLFGTGVDGVISRYSDKHVSAGILSISLENGLVGAVLMLFFIVAVSGKNKLLIIIAFSSLLVFESYKFPLFWMSLIVSRALMHSSDIRRKCT